MADVAAFTVKPPLRCFGKWPMTHRLVCGARAAWMRPGLHGGAAQFFCDRCKGPNDVPIPDDVIFRRLTVSLDVLFAGVELLPAEAEAEAVTLLERLVVPAGGLICVHGVVHQVGRWTPSPPPAGTPAKKGRGQ